MLENSVGQGYIERDDIMLGNTPFTHGSGLWLFSSALSIGATVVLVDGSELDKVVSAIEKYKVSMRLLGTHEAQNSLCEHEEL